tara:strand:+ start:4316 stop:5401 length:1086 start_codon:yes stop_codon:yes gene_type:complete
MSKIKRDHHLLTRNLKLNGKYISNDGGDDGIKISDSAEVSIESTGTHLKLQYDADNYMTLATGANGDTTLTTVDQGVGEVAHLTLDIDGEIINDSKVGRTRFYLNGGTADYAQIRILLNGITEFSTVDADASDADLSIVPDGELILDAQNSDGNSNHGIQLKANAAGEGGSSQLFGVLTQHHAASHFTLYEGGGTSTDDYFNIAVATEGATTISTVDANAAVAHLNIAADGHVEFDGCAVGFDLVTPTYDATNTIVDFRTGNKQMVTFGSGNIVSIKFYFPATSGNFVCLLKQDGTGSRTVTNYKVYDYLVNVASGSAGTKFAGGSNPTLTTDANHVDIISIFWDADNEIAYGVASLDFQF